uniref:Uncharacterized protein n=1 Tax=Clastoptera arizonana TaxID=38151 RepID=A0A1B6DR15_9HEMI
MDNFCKSIDISVVSVLTCIVAVNSAPQILDHFYPQYEMSDYESDASDNGTRWEAVRQEIKALGKKSDEIRRRNIKYMKTHDVPIDKQYKLYQQIMYAEVKVLKRIRQSWYNYGLIDVGDEAYVRKIYKLIEDSQKMTSNTKEEQVAALKNIYAELYYLRFQLRRLRLS